MIHDPKPSAYARDFVAQICNLRYRGIPFCGGVECARRREKFQRLADFKSAMQQRATLRYSHGGFPQLRFP